MELNVQVDELKSQPNKFYLIEISKENKMVYGMLNNNEKEKGEECTKIKIDEINSFTQNKLFFKCKHSFNFLQSFLDVQSTKQQFIHVFI